MSKGKPWSPLKAAVIAFIAVFLLVAVVSGVVMTARHPGGDSFAQGEAFGKAAAPMILGLSAGAALLAYFAVKRRDRGE